MDNTIKGRLLFSDAAQRASLGSALLDNSLMRGPLARLAVNDFAGTADRIIYALMLELSEGGEPFDTCTLAQILEDRGQLETVGGGSYLGVLTEGAVPEPGLVKWHVATIQRLSSLRRLQALAEHLGDHVTELGAQPEQLLHKLKAAVELLAAGCDLDGHLLPIAPHVCSRQAEILTLSQVESKAVNWLWEPYLPVGMLSMLSGDPGGGKTLISLAIAADVTLGKIPFSGEPRKVADVLYLSVENSPEYVLRPRFDSLGGNPERFHILRGSVTGGAARPCRASIRLSDIELLNDALLRTEARLVIVDPIQSYLGAEVDAHRSNETRPVMDGLSRLAEEHSCCILIVRHLGKAQTGRAIHRGLGSIDLTGAVRTELLAGCSADDPATRALVQMKSNLGQFGPSLGYTIGVDGKFRWTGESQLTVSSILAPEANEEDTGAMAEAKDFLSALLAGGARLAKEVHAEAQQHGISERTLKRAKKELKVLSRKVRMDGPWEWVFPEGCQQ